MTAFARIYLSLAVLFAVGCVWEADPPGSSQSSLDEKAACQGDGGGLDFDGTGLPACGEPFQTQRWGECNDCSDKGCTMADEGVFTCKCHAVDEYCWDRTNDAGVVTGEACQPFGAQCDCGDGEGPIYECSCETGENTSPSECACVVPRDSGFDYEFDCEQKGL